MDGQKRPPFTHAYEDLDDTAGYNGMTQDMKELEKYVRYTTEFVGWIIFAILFFACVVLVAYRYNQQKKVSAISDRKIQNQKKSM